MITKTEEPTQIKEINIETLKKNYLLEGFTQTSSEENNNLHVNVNVQFHNFSEIGYTIESLLTAVRMGIEKDESLEKIDINNIVDLSRNLVNKLPLEFLDSLLIKQDCNKKDFKNIENI